jgi:pre-mRNA-splicing factor ATP-dependent RNA helicase DHX15/PRP43
MATKREFDADDSASVKRVKMENGNGKLDPASNPYLAHWDEPKADQLSSFKRHATTAKAAKAAEDGPLNPFTGVELSNNYMAILKKRRDLPVHQQR